MTSHGFNEQPLKLRLSEVESWRKQSGLANITAPLYCVNGTTNVSLALGKANMTSHRFNEQPLKSRLSEVESWRKQSGLVIANKWMRGVMTTPYVSAKS
ncbi:hypothetical protein CDAR_488121 [Caerostris darwini]|uniref:Uncharacterized protein n=1 Tax=Caerostris darwini TaxID=1538125 RepID=A0AAV4R984_9ARAC|nr:hypothetical protein CDAR_488121 [Caerostris darwini]